MQNFQPSNRIGLTNVAVIRLKKGGKRFEVAAYPNKVREWRSGVETDLSEVTAKFSGHDQVLITGQLAPKSDLQKAFGNEDVQSILLEILKKGEIQVNEKERGHELGNLRREVATFVAEHCVDPTSGKPHTVSMVEKAMDHVHFAVKSGKSAKSQGLELIKILQNGDVISIQRARMRVRISMPSKEGKRLKEKVMPSLAVVESEDIGPAWEVTAQIDPGQYKVLNELLEKEIKGGQYRVETLNLSIGDDT